MDKVIAKNLQRDFVPNGRRIDIRTLEFRRTLPHEVYQCCIQTGDDYPQSGPIFCGRVAEFVHICDEGVVALCGERRHVPPMRKE